MTAAPGVGIDDENRGLRPDVMSLRPGHPVRFVPGPQNRFDDQAVLILADEDNQKAGYVPRTMNVGVGDSRIDPDFIGI